MGIRKSLESSACSRGDYWACSLHLDGGTRVCWTCGLALIIEPVPSVRYDTGRQSASQRPQNDASLVARNELRRETSVVLRQLHWPGPVRRCGNQCIRDTLIRPASCSSATTIGAIDVVDFLHIEKLADQIELNS